MAHDRHYQETIDYLYGLQKHGIKLALSNSARLMSLMGDPHKRFQSVHVAGTNGKGSTSSFLAGMLQAAGYRVGLYTSPHLVDFTERIRINGRPITGNRVVELARRVRERYQQTTDNAGAVLNPTFFEVTTALAFTFFAEEGLDIAVVEVGMGGRLDSTNVITPLVSVITNIELEHTEFLGDTLSLIAAEKAGIIKDNVPVVTGVSQPEVIEIIERTAAARQAPLYRMPKNFAPERIFPEQPPRFHYRGIRAAYPDMRLSMLGGHQVDNACLALAAIECLRESGMPVDETAVRLGLERTRWEGRLEKVSARPDIYLDGAHNPASARALARAIAEMKPAYQRLLLVIGVLGDKDFRGILSELVPLADSVVATKPDYGRALDVEVLAAEARKLHNAVDTAACLAAALAQVREKAMPGDLIIITGSLYVVGDARGLFSEAAGKNRILSGLKG